MKYKVIKKINKNYDIKYTKEKDTQEIQLTFGNCKIYISEQQFGCRHTPYVDIVTSKCTYSMSLNDLLHKIDPNVIVTETSLM